MPFPPFMVSSSRRIIAQEKDNVKISLVEFFGYLLYNWEAMLHGFLSRPR